LSLKFQENSKKNQRIFVKIKEFVKKFLLMDGVIKAVGGKAAMAMMVCGFQRIQETDSFGRCKVPLFKGMTRVKAESARLVEIAASQYVRNSRIL